MGGDTTARPPRDFSPRRRDLIRLGAAALAPGAGACTPPRQEIVPYARAPEQSLPGEPYFYATAMTLAGYGRGLLVEANRGRPSKIEGNPAHPASLGATDVYAQASVLQLWDPDRSQAPRRAGALATLGAFATELDARLAAHAARDGAGLALLTGYAGSPTLMRQIAALHERYPRLHWHQWEPLHRDRSLAGARAAFGRPLVPRYRFDRAAVVVALDADFLSHDPESLVHARHCAARRAGRAPLSRLSRLYALEPDLTLAGALADHRYPMRNEEIERWLAELAAALGMHLPDAPVPGPRARAVARDLMAHPREALLVAGESLPPAAHALVHALNERLQAPGSTVEYGEVPAGLDGDCTASIMALVERMRAGAIDTLIMLGGNPAYDAPADAAFARALARVPWSAHLGLYRDETGTASTWHVPATHFLEHWSDTVALDGTAALVQPAIAPLHDGVSPHELLAMLARAPGTSGHELVRTTWHGRWGGDGFEERWRTALRRGVVAGTAGPALTPTARAPLRFDVPPSAGLSMRILPDPAVRDGEFTNNAWLQELPRPASKLTWDNAVHVAPADARELGLATGDIVELAAGAAHIAAPVWIAPGHAPGAVSVTLGYGRSHAGSIGNGVGFDAYRLRTAGAQWTVHDVGLRRTGERRALAFAQLATRMHGREIARHATAAAFQADPDRFHAGPHASLYPAWRYDDYHWGMSIDLNACIGCNACTIACQAENNIPVVGRDEVRRGREMHWIRVDRYDEGPSAAPRVLFQPVPCMHCDNAPCEPVCPVAASVHDSEGLNLQVYNRCVGTRFCSQNCPYKVRRFNFLQYSGSAPGLAAQRNPEVTVRARGVMEKCTYCVQRIARARIETEKEHRRIRDGEVVTACEAVCPARAIVFGDMNDATSRVVAAKRSPLDYALLGELNTRPCTTYLARITNPDPALEND